MADNNYNPNNDAAQFYSRTNKLALESNALQMKVERQYCEQLELVGDFVVDSGAETVTFTAASPTSGYDVRYFQIFIQDESGNSASSTVTDTALAAPVVVDIAALNANDNWYITVYFSNEKEVVIDCGCKTFGEIKVVAPSSDPTVSVNTVLQDAQIIEVFEADGTTAIVDGGAAYDLGSFPAGGGSEAATIIVKNAGDMVLKIETLAFAADVDAISTTTPQYIYAAGSGEVNFTVDTSGGAGAKTGSITITSDDPANSSYIVNIAFTLV
jgi:hypothetical protein